METPTAAQLQRAPAAPGVRLWALCPTCARIWPHPHGYTVPLCACSPAMPPRPPRLFAMSDPDRP